MIDKKSKPRIGILLRNRHDGAGGLEKVLNIVARDLQAQGYDVYGYSLYPIEYNEFTSTFTTVKYLQVPSFWSFFFETRPSKLSRIMRKFYVYFYGDQLFKMMIEDQIDLLITLDLSKQFIQNSRSLRGLKAQSKIPILSWVHASLSNDKKKLVENVRKNIGIFDGHLAISQGLAQELRNVYGAQSVYTIYNPVVSGEMIPRDQRKFIYIGRIDSNKRVHSLLKQLGLLLGDWHLDIYGTTGSAIKDKEFEAFIQSLNLIDQVDFHGWHPDPWSQIQSAGILLLNSLSEGFGLVIIEAMQRGIPVVSSNCPVGPPELIKPEVNGWLYPVDKEGYIVDILQGIVDGGTCLPAQNMVKESVKQFNLDAYMSKLTQTLNAFIACDKVQKDNRNAED